MNRLDLLSWHFGYGRPALWLLAALAAVALGLRWRDGAPPPSVAPCLLLGGVVATIDGSIFGALVTDVSRSWRVTVALDLGVSEAALLWAALPGGHALGSALRLGLRGARPRSELAADSLVVVAATLLVLDSREPMAALAAGAVLLGGSEAHLRTAIRRDVALVWLAAVITAAGHFLLTVRFLGWFGWFGWSALPLLVAAGAVLVTTGMGPSRRTPLLVLGPPLVVATVVGAALLLVRVLPPRW